MHGISVNFNDLLGFKRQLMNSKLTAIHLKQMMRMNLQEKTILIGDINIEDKINSQMTN